MLTGDRAVQCTSPELAKVVEMAGMFQRLSLILTEYLFSMWLLALLKERRLQLEFKAAEKFIDLALAALTTAKTEKIAPDSFKVRTSRSLHQ